jgi:hypothetical protein
MVVPYFLDPYFFPSSYGKFYYNLAVGSIGHILYSVSFDISIGGCQGELMEKELHLRLVSHFIEV